MKTGDIVWTTVNGFLLGSTAYAAAYNFINGRPVSAWINVGVFLFILVLSLWGAWTTYNTGKLRDIMTYMDGIEDTHDVRAGRKPIEDIDAKIVAAISEGSRRFPWSKPRARV